MVDHKEAAVATKREIVFFLRVDPPPPHATHALFLPPPNSPMYAFPRKLNMIYFWLPTRTDKAFEIVVVC